MTASERIEELEDALEEAIHSMLDHYGYDRDLFKRFCEIRDKKWWEADNG